MLEQNTHRLAMTILGIVVLAMVVGGLYVAGFNPNANAKDDTSLFHQTSFSIVEQNENRTPKY